MDQTRRKESVHTTSEEHYDTRDEEHISEVKDVVESVDLLDTPTPILRRTSIAPSLDSSLISASFVSNAEVSPVNAASNHYFDLISTTKSMKSLVNLDGINSNFFGPTVNTFKKRAPVGQDRTEAEMRDTSPASAPNRTSRRNTCPQFTSQNGATSYGYSAPIINAGAYYT